MQKTITRYQALCKLLANGNKVIMAGFRRSTDGEMRYMVGHPDIFASISGNGIKYNPIEKGLLVIPDAEADGARMLNVNTLKYVVLDGVSYTVTD